MFLEHQINLPLIKVTSPALKKKCITGDHVSRGDPNTYQLVNHEDGDKPIFGRFYQEDLSLINGIQ